MGKKKKDNQEAVPVTRSYPYTANPSYPCKIDAVPQPPVFKHPKGWSPALCRKLEKLRLQKEESDK